MGDKIRNLLQEALENRSFRKVLWAGDHLQVVVQSLDAGEETEHETHDEDQVSTIVDGEGEVTLDDEDHDLCAGWSALIKAGVEHCFKNTGEGKLCILTFYAPPRDVEDEEETPEVPAEGENGGEGELPVEPNQDLPEVPVNGAEETPDEGGDEGTVDVPPVPTEPVEPLPGEPVEPPVEAGTLPVFPEEEVPADGGNTEEPPTATQLPA